MQINLLFKNKYTKETFWSFLAQGVAFVFFIALNVFLARYLGPRRFGTWSFFFSIVNIVLLLSYFGINASSQKYIAQYNETDKLGAILRSSLKLRIIVSFGFVIIFLAIYKPLTNILQRSDFEWLFLAATPLIFFASLTEYLKSVFQGLHRLKYTFYINTSEYGLKFLFAVFFLFFANKLILIIYSFGLALLVTSLIGLYFLYFHFYKSCPTSDSNFRNDILKYSFPLFFVAIGFVIVTEVDTVMIGVLSTDSQVGIYAAAKQIIIKLPHIALAISLGTMPVFARLTTENKENLKSIFYKLLKTNSIIFGGIGALILSTSWFFMPLIFGAKYKESVIPLMILVPYLLFFSYSIFLSSFLDYQGKATKRAVNLIIAIVLNILLNMFLIPQYGATGAALATSISYFPYILFNWIEVQKILKNY